MATGSTIQWGKAHCCSVTFVSRWLQSILRREKACCYTIRDMNGKLLSETRCKHIHVRSNAASMRHTVSDNSLPFISLTVNGTAVGKASFVSLKKDSIKHRFITIIILLLSATPGYATENNQPGSTAEQCLPVEKTSSNSPGEELTPLPATQLFEPLRADPKEPRFFVSALKVDSAIQNTTIAAVGFGENFGIVRHGSNPKKGWQLGLSAAVFAQFDLESESSDLMNADYVIGVPVTWRSNDWSGRVRVYHQSSHLGDEFLLRVQPERVNLSFESIEVLVAHDFAGIRAYGGGEYLFHREPSDLAEGLIHIGLDWRNSETTFGFSHLGAARWVAGLDVKHWQHNDGAIQLSAKAGLEFAPLANINNSTSNSARRWSVLLELYDGASPYGQFYQDDLRYWGIAIQLGL